MSWGGSNIVSRISIYVFAFVDVVHGNSALHIIHNIQDSIVSNPYSLPQALLANQLSDTRWPLLVNKPFKLRVYAGNQAGRELHEFPFGQRLQD